MPIAPCCLAISSAFAFRQNRRRHCWCLTLRSAATKRGRYVLVVNKDNVVEQRKIEARQLVGDLRVIDSGLTKDDRVVVGGIMRAIPGQKVDPELSTPAAAK
jgi:hypothetical protein